MDPPISKPSQLVARLKDVYDVTGHEELARRLGVPLRTLQRWATDDAMPSFATTLRLLEAAGWLNTNGAAPVAEDGPRDRLAELEATVEAQGAATTQALKALTAGIRKLERQIGAEAPPAKRAAR